jgi:hypothetical protein
MQAGNFAGAFRNTHTFAFLTCSQAIEIKSYLAKFCHLTDGWFVVQYDLQSFLSKLEIDEDLRARTLSILQTEGVNVTQLCGDISDRELLEIGIERKVCTEIRRFADQASKPPTTQVRCPYSPADSLFCLIA